MAEAIHESLCRFHASLNVADLSRSIAFYRVLLGVEPAKQRPDYAKFELTEPPLILSLVPGQTAGASLNHVGLRVRTTGELVDVQRRLESAGISTKREDDVECCYARQTKFWVGDPDGLLWEIYVFHEDIEERGDATVPLNAPAPAQKPQWAHKLGEAFPERIPHEANSLFVVTLEGSVNAEVSAPHRSGLIAEALRVLRPGGEIQIHGLAGDRSTSGERIELPFPASAVKYVPTAAEVVDELARAGFVDAQIETLSERAYFVVAGVPMRELRARARKPGHRPKQQTHHAIYRGPLTEVKDDFGNVFRRGELTPLNIHDWQMLSQSPAAGSFLLLAPEKASG
jgi:catechol 2,3-dioxygenase-like lactoylglutathione lyase family enzyme